MSEEIKNEVPAEVVPVKRGRGRPKGWRKDKDSIAAKKAISGITPVVAPAISDITPVLPEKKVVGVTEKVKVKQEDVDVDPSFLLTTTYNGTPIALVSTCRYGTSVEFICLANYKHNQKSRSVVKSEDILKPKNMTPEQEEEFIDVKWWEAEVVAPVEPVTPSML